MAFGLTLTKPGAYQIPAQQHPHYQNLISWEFTDHLEPT
ncbi:hypothetical protein EMIT0P176_50018 [Pseudomonas sp. IT-P176]